MKKLILFLIILNFIQCKKETNPIANDVQKDTLALNSNSETILVKSDKVKGAWFQAKVPKGFEIQPSVVSSTITDDYDSYFYESPDGLVKFYVYSPQWNGTPNDITFPNEKIEVETVSNDDGSTTRYWTLPPNKQHPYYRSFAETKSESSILITGFYYKDEAARTNYSEAYKEFKNSVIQFAD